MQVTIIIIIISTEGLSNLPKDTQEVAEPGYMAPRSELLTTILYCLSGYGQSQQSGRQGDGERGTKRG